MRLAASAILSRGVQRQGSARVASWLDFFLGLVDALRFGGYYPVDGRWPGGRVAGGLGFLVHGSEARQLRWLGARACAGCLPSSLELALQCIVIAR